MWYDRELHHQILQLVLSNSLGRNDLSYININIHNISMCLCFPNLLCQKQYKSNYCLLKTFIKYFSNRKVMDIPFVLISALAWYLEVLH